MKLTCRKPRILFLLLFTLPAAAQIGAAGTQGQGVQANPVPLSGRSGQSGTVTATQSPVPGTTTSVNTINPVVQVQGQFTGSVLSVRGMPFSGKLSLREAVQRGLGYNLGAINQNQAVRQAEGQNKIVRSVLFPNLSGTISETAEQVNLRALGIRFNIPVPGFTAPSIVGPFNFVDFRARLSESVADWTAWSNYRASKEIVHANQFLARDARDLITLAVGGEYLQVVAAKARVDSAHAQLDTANALYDQTSQKKGVGLVAQIDVNRSQVQALTQQQRLISLQNDLAKLKIQLARSIGLPANDQYELTDDVPFSPLSALSLEDALKQAFAQRADLKAAQAQLRAAERAHTAARAERIPSLAVNADYGVIGTTPSQSHGTFAVSGTVHIPLWQGGRTEGAIQQADAAVMQRRAELEDLKSQVEADVRNAWLDLQASANQVEVSRKNVETSRQTLELTRQRLDAGVTDSLEVVQSQEALATAELDYINSVFAHNLAKLSLARALGSAADNLQQFLSFH